MDFSSFLGSQLEGQRKCREHPQGWDVGRPLGLTNNNVVANHLDLAGKRLAMQLWGGAQLGQLFCPNTTPHSEQCLHLKVRLSRC